MNDGPKLFERRKFEENMRAPKCPQRKNSGYEKENCHVGANKDNRPPKYN